jgi:hypothetical protein
MRFACRAFRSLIVNQSPMFKGWISADCAPGTQNRQALGRVMEHLKNALAFALDIEPASD